jgi:lysophospholipase L1-like esterase
MKYMSSQLKMNNIVSISAVLAVASCLGWSGLAGAEEPKADMPAGKTVLFLGDSITAAGGYVRIIEAELAKQAPPWKVINHGMSSETVSDLSEEYHPGRRPCLFSRLDKELADAKPDWVVACYGINDGIYHPYNEKRFAAYQAGVMTLIKKVKASGARLVLLTAPPYAKPGPELPKGISAAEADKLLVSSRQPARSTRGTRRWHRLLGHALKHSVRAPTHPSGRS